MSKFYEEIKKCKQEREVEQVYNNELKKYFKGADIIHPYECDGYIEVNFDFYKECDLLRLIMEYKYEKILSNVRKRSEVLIQVIYYMKKFYENELIVPNVVLVGDNKELFVMHTQCLRKYLEEPVDWSIAPSCAYKFNQVMLKKMIEDTDINPYIYTISSEFKFIEVINQIKDLTQDIKRYVKLSQTNIRKIFDSFTTGVLKNQKRINPNEVVNIFIQVMINPDDCYPHPNKDNILVIKHKEVKVDIKAFEAFCNYFDRHYTSYEKAKFTEVADQLIDEHTRRRHGEFYTPTIWVNEAHHMMNKTFGEDWKENYIVWDCAWGTGNLTRDYAFERLFCSTLNKSDLEQGEKYNADAIEKFEYDFLNDDVDLIDGQIKWDLPLKLPPKLQYYLQQKRPIIFLLNPPFATANNAGRKRGDHKEGTAKTKMRLRMKEDRIGESRQQLYAQFLYRILLIKKIYGIAEVHMGIFTPTLLLTGGSFKDFRKAFLDIFKYQQGMLFSASNFADAKNNWGIAFTTWKSGKTNNKTTFDVIMKEFDPYTQCIVNRGNKKVYNLDDEKSSSEWIKEETKNIKTKDAPQLTNAVNIKQQGRGAIIPNALGYYVNVSNNVYKNTTDVFLLTSTATTANGISIIRENLMKVVSNFAARKLISGKYITWKNDKDEYCIPNIAHEKYDEWNKDALIYALFNESSQQSSLRQITYKDKLYKCLPNEFFFMSVEEVKNLANEYSNDSIYYDCIHYGNERYIHEIIKNCSLSEEASDVLREAVYLIQISFKYRKEFSALKPHYYINAWDAGWYQIKQLLKFCNMQGKLDNFNLKYKKLEDKMRPFVYELGFLRD